jgi:hypothetical protein
VKRARGLAHATKDGSINLFISKTHIGIGREESVKRLVSLILMFLVVLPAFIVFRSQDDFSARAMAADSMFLEPSRALIGFTNGTAVVGSKFNVTVWLNMTTPAYAWQFYLVYDKSYIYATRCCYTGNGKSQWSGALPTITGACPVFGSKNSTHNYICFTEVLMCEREKTGCGSLAWVEFEIEQAPSQNQTLATGLNLDNRGPNCLYSYVLDVASDEIPVKFGNGYYEITCVASPYYDLAVSNVTVSKSTAVPGDVVDIYVNVTNYGNVLEDSQVTAYADADTTVIGDETIIGTQGIVILAQSSELLSFSWDTSAAPPGSLTISAKVNPVAGETNTTDNLLSDGVIQILPYIHDVTVTGVSVTESAIYVGDSVHANVDVENQGNIMETFNVTLYADRNTTVIGDEVVVGTKTVSLARYSGSTENFDWGTLGVLPGNYTLTGAASPVPYEVDLTNNNRTGPTVQVFNPVPCPDVNVTCPTALTVNPSIFTFDYTLHARLINIGNVTVQSTGFEGWLRVVGSRNGTIRLCVNQPDTDYYMFNLPKNGTVQVPIWLMFQPEEHWGLYNGNYTLTLTVCGTHRRQLTIRGISINICQNGAYIINSQTVTFEWNLRGGSLVYLTAEPDLPPGWTYTVNPPVGTFFETPHTVTVNITAPPDAKAGETGRVTLRAYKNSTGALIWQFVYFATTNNKPPTVERLETPVWTLDGHMLFNTTVKGSSGVAQVLLHYSVDNGPWQNDTMQWTSGDTFNSTQYTSQEFVGTGAKNASYYISATDWLRNQTTSPTQTVRIRNDLAITKVTADKTLVPLGSSLTLNVTVANLGTLPLSFANVAVYINSTLTATRPVFMLRNGTSATVTVPVDTTGLKRRSILIITAYATCLPGEANTLNNAMHLKPNLEVAVHDVAVVNVDNLKSGCVPLPTVCQGMPCDVHVTVKDTGDFTETFNVTAYANTTIIGKRKVTLNSGQNTTLTFTWNTTGFVEYDNYTISATAGPVSGETNLADNTLTDGTVTVVHQGDVDGNGFVDGKDIAKVAGAFGSLRVDDPKDPRYGQYWHPTPCWLCPHSPNADIDGNGFIDTKDLAKTAANYGWLKP